MPDCTGDRRAQDGAGGGGDLGGGEEGVTGDARSFADEALEEGELEGDRERVNVGGGEERVEG